jgi:rhamnosyltransferase
MKDVTILLLMREPRERELRTVELVRSQEYDGAAVVHVIDSSDRIDTEIVTKIKGMVDRWDHIEPETFSHGGTRNAGVDATETALFVSLSSDAHPMHTGWLSALLKPLNEGSADASYGGQRSPDGDPERDATYNFLYPEEPVVKTKADLPTMGLRTFHFSDVSSAFLTEVIAKLRYPEVSIFQDVGIAKSLLDGGYRIAYEPDASVYHAHPMTWRSMWARYRGLGEVWERHGLFEEIKAGSNSGGLIRTGLGAVRRMVPRTGKNPVRFARSLAIGAVKGLAVTQGRRDAHRRAPLALEWDAKEGSRAVRRNS